MNKNILIPVVVLLVIIAGVYYYSSATPPVLTDEQAVSLAKATWGDCTPDTCSKVEVSVNRSGDPVYVTATYEGLRDDSVEAQRKTAPVTYSKGQWVLGEASMTQRCQKARGHLDFTTESCM